MKSPITGKEMKLTVTIREMDGTKFHFWAYRCDSGELFTNTDLDTINMFNYELKRYDQLTDIL